jgi:hypothetical protein
MSSKCADLGRARRAREESRRLGELMNDERERCKTAATGFRVIDLV